MPVALIAVSMLVVLVVATPADASPSCRSKAEARQHFGSVHIYWHGRDHCWDATPTRRFTRIHSVQRRLRNHEVQRNVDKPKWHESMSEMLLDAEPVETPAATPPQTSPQTPWTSRWVDIEPSTPPLDARWVDIAQVKPPSIIERKPGSTVSPHVVLLVFITFAIVLTLASIEFLFRRTIY